LVDCRVVRLRLWFAVCAVFDQDLVGWGTPGEALRCFSWALRHAKLVGMEFFSQHSELDVRADLGFAKGHGHPADLDAHVVVGLVNLGRGDRCC
jgi:hypothetical protein